MNQRKPDKRMVGVWLTPAERRPIERAAKSEGRTVSDWLRRYVPELARQQLNKGTIDAPGVV